MKENVSECCPYCGCGNVIKTENSGLIEIGPFEMEEQEESIPVDIWICPECQRRFVMLDTDENTKDEKKA